MEVPRRLDRPPGPDSAGPGRLVALPDADELAALDREQLTATDDDLPPWLPPGQDPPPTTWTIVEGSDAPPF